MIHIWEKHMKFFHYMKKMYRTTIIIASLAEEILQWVCGARKRLLLAWFRTLTAHYDVGLGHHTDNTAVRKPLVKLKWQNCFPVIQIMVLFCSPANFVTCLCSAKRWSSHHWHLNCSRVFSHHSVKLHLQSPTCCLQHLQLRLHVVQPLANSLADGH